MTSQASIHSATSLRLLGSHPAARRSKKVPQVLPEVSLLQLLALPDLSTDLGCRDRAILAVLVACGLRASELLALRYCDIGGDYIFVPKGKGGRQRYVPITPWAVEAIDAYSDFPGMPGERVFKNAWGQPLSRRGLYSIVKGYLQELGFFKASLHTLRHSAATLWLDKGINLSYVQVMLGHADIRTTSIYLHTAVQAMVGEYKRRFGGFEPGV